MKMFIGDLEPAELLFNRSGRSFEIFDMIIEKQLKNWWIKLQISTGEIAATPHISITKLSLSKSGLVTQLDKQIE